MSDVKAVYLINPVEVSNAFNDSEGEPTEVGTSTASDGTSVYAARRDHKHKINTAELDARYVNLTGDETISGVKTFSSFPITPSSAPTSDYEVANKKYVDDTLATADEASEISIADAGGYYTGTNVEDALQEIGDGTTLDPRYVNVTGDTMTGALTITPSADSTSIFNVTNSAGTSVLNVDTTNGRVGIGTTSPLYKLSIVGNNSPQIQFGNGNNNGGGFIGSSGNSQAIIYGGASWVGGIWTARYTSASGLIIGELGNIRFIANSGLTIGNTFTPTERMRLHASGGLSLGSTYVGTDPGPGSIIISGNVGIGTTTPTEQLDLSGDAIRIRTPYTPSSSSDTGDKGKITWDSDYLYIWVDTNVVKRVALSSF